MIDEEDDSKTDPLLIEPARLTAAPAVLNHETLKYHLLGPSLTKSGQDNVDQQKVQMTFVVTVVRARTDWCTGI